MSVDELWRSADEQREARLAYRPKHGSESRRRSDVAAATLAGQRIESNAAHGVPVGRHRRRWYRVLRRHA